MPITILGIDPGSRHVGWGVVRAEGTRISHVAHGVISPGAEDRLEERLVYIDDALRETVGTFAPDAAAVESIFFAKDAQAAAKLGHARGVILLGLCRAHVPLAEYAPTHIKKAIVGRGLADKRQVAMVVQALLRLSALPRPDAADALAIAITHTRALAMNHTIASHHTKPRRIACIPG